MSRTQHAVTYCRSQRASIAGDKSHISQMILKPEYANGLFLKSKSGTSRRKPVLELKLRIKVTFFFNRFGGKVLSFSNRMYVYRRNTISLALACYYSVHRSREHRCHVKK
jgi:hypothetical protein